MARLLSGALASAAVLDGCGDAPTGPPLGDVAAFNAKTEAMRSAAADPKFDDFRAACADYNSTRSRAAELEVKMHARTASPEEVKTWKELAPLIESEAQGNCWPTSKGMESRRRTETRCSGS